MCYFALCKFFFFFIISLTIILIGLLGMDRSVLTITYVNKQLLMCITDVSYNSGRGLDRCHVHEANAIVHHCSL